LKKNPVNIGLLITETACEGRRGEKVREDRQEELIDSHDGSSGGSLC
jgi:hypothetical protein